MVIVVCLVVGLLQAADLGVADDGNGRAGPASRGSGLGAAWRWRVALIVAALASTRPAASRTPGTNSRRPAGPGRDGRLGTPPESRYQYWNAAVDQIATKPLTGTGSGTFEFWWTATATRRVVRDAHSLYLQTLGELGIVGFSCLLAFLPRPRRRRAALLGAPRSAVSGRGAGRLRRLLPRPRRSTGCGRCRCCRSPRCCSPPSWSSPAAREASCAFAPLAVWRRRLSPRSSRSRSRSPRQPRPQSEAAARAGDLAARSTARGAPRTSSRGTATPRLQQALVLEQQGDLPGPGAAREATERESTNWRTWLVLSRSKPRRPGRRRGCAYREARRSTPSRALRPLDGWPRSLGRLGILPRVDLVRKENQLADSSFAALGPFDGLLRRRLRETVIDDVKAEGGDQESLEKSLHEKIMAVDCPSDEKVEAGKNFACTVKYSDGKQATATLKILNEDADVSLRPQTEEPREQANERPDHGPPAADHPRQASHLGRGDRGPHPARSIHWCDGSAEEYDALAQTLIDAGTFERLSDAKRPNSYLALSDPGDVARVEDRTFICSEREDDAGPTNNWRDPAEMRKAATASSTARCGAARCTSSPSRWARRLPIANIGVQLTDSAYVADHHADHDPDGQGRARRARRRRRLRPLPALGRHAAGRGQGGRRLAMQRGQQVHRPLPGDARIWSFGSGYGGNALLGKKCLALRIASAMARERAGWPSTC